ncbi:DUF523 domain-containing protein [Kaarinaea lacus]
MPKNRITIGVSSCLLGHKIRYDGNDKLNTIVENIICKHFHCIPLCPEFAVGLGVPRDPVQLVQTGDSIRVFGVGNPSLEITALLQQYADFVCDVLPEISGYVFKARSPSCGLVDTPIFNKNGCEIATGRGAYARQIILRKQALPVIDETRLIEPARRAEFIQKVEHYSQSIQR